MSRFLKRVILRTCKQPISKTRIQTTFPDSLDSNIEMVDVPNLKPCAKPSASADGCPPVVSTTDMKWFVVRVTYSRELMAKKFLQEEGVECYVPMRQERDDDGSRFVPAVHNLIFVHSTRKFMDSYKRKMEGKCPLRYMMDKSTSLPMVVRDKEMEDFIRVTTDMGEGVLYLDNPSVVAEKGVSVEIVNGSFKGVQGKLMRIRRDRKVALQLAGLIAVAVDGIPMEWCKLIDD